MWRNVRTWMGATVGAMVCAGTALAAPPNDDCANRSPISGGGSWYVDLIGSTPSAQVFCPGFTPGNDVWYCWTASWTGTAAVGGFYLLPDGTTGECYGIQVFDGCSCTPTGTQLACQQTCQPLTLNVSCGHQYLIRVVDIFAGLGNTGAVLTINPGANAQPCPDPTGQDCSSCCGTAPQYTNSAFAPFMDGRLAVETHADFGTAAANDIVLRVKDLNITPCPTAGGEWLSSTAQLFPPTAAGTDWTRERIGTVFATTFDDQGNLYLGRFNGWIGLGTQGTIGGKATSIIKIASGTAMGTASVFATLPDPNPALPAGDGDTRPGIGDVVFDCSTQTFFASHLSDGRIYQLSTSGAILGWYDHATGTGGAGSALDCTAPGAACDGRYRQFAPLGERVWAVKPHNGRLYYSVWGQDSRFAATSPNQIWSVAITAGTIVPSSRRMEVQMPTLPVVAGWNTNDKRSSPVADIEFTGQCRMLLAERSMYNDSGTGAHQSRLLEYALNPASNSWIPTSNYNAGLGFSVGVGSGTNAAGGCDVDLVTTGGSCPGTDGRLWASSDYMGGTVQFAYGITGIKPDNSGVDLLIDYNNANDSTADKTKQGDVEVPCFTGPCATLSEETLTAELNAAGQPTGCYIYKFRLTNNSGHTVQYMLIPNTDVTPNVIFFGPSPYLLNGQTSSVKTVRICNQAPGTDFQLPIILMDTTNNECCTFDHEVHIPTCFAQPAVAYASCSSQGCNLSVTIQPLLYNIGHVFAIYEGPPPNVNILNAYQPVVPPLNQYGSAKFDFQFTGAQVGQQLCFRIFTHTPNAWQCCSELVCVTVGGTCPECPMNGGACDIDFNNDGLFPDTLDIDDLLSTFGGGFCSNMPFCDDIDINDDGLFPDTEDIADFLLMFSGGNC